MAIDPTFTRIVDSASYPIYEGSGFIEEGKFLVTDPSFFNGTEMTVGVMETPAATSTFVGMAYSYFTVPEWDIAVDTATIPASADANGNFSIPLSQVPNTTTYKAFAKLDDGTVLTFSTSTTTSSSTTSTTSSPAAKSFSISGQNAYFNAAQAGANVTIVYRYAISVFQAQFKYGDGVAGKSVAADYTQTIGVVRAGNVATTCFNPGVDYTSGAPLKVGANGDIDPSYPNGVSIPSAYVLAPPTADAPSLKLYFKA